MSVFVRQSYRYFAIASLAVTAACGGKITPEQEIRALVREAELAVEERQAGDFARLISERYEDRQGNDKETLVRSLRLHMIRNQAIYLLVQTADVTVRENVSATAVVRVAMAGGPLTGLEDLPKLGAELYRFNLELIREDAKWRIIGAQWERALEREFR